METNTPKTPLLARAEWLRRCESALITEGGLSGEDARQAAIAALQLNGDDLASDPRAAARKMLDDEDDAGE